VSWPGLLEDRRTDWTLWIHLNFNILSTGYYLTTLEASAQHISDLARQFEQSNLESDIFDPRQSHRLSASDMSRSSIFSSSQSFAEDGTGYFDKDGHATVDTVDTMEPFGVNFNATSWWRSIMGNLFIHLMIDVSMTHHCLTIHCLLLWNYIRPLNLHSRQVTCLMIVFVHTHLPR